jgi:hypothetical protein
LFNREKTDDQGLGKSLVTKKFIIKKRAGEEGGVNVTGDNKSG